MDDDERIHQALLVAAERTAKEHATSNPTGYARRVLRNFNSDGTADAARRYLSEYPDLTANQLADVVLGNTNLLRSMPRAIRGAS